MCHSLNGMVLPVCVCVWWGGVTCGGTTEGYAFKQNVLQIRIPLSTKFQGVLFSISQTWCLLTFKNSLVSSESLLTTANPGDPTEHPNFTGWSSRNKVTGGEAHNCCPFKKCTHWKLVKNWTSQICRPLYEARAKPGKGIEAKSSGPGWPRKWGVRGVKERRKQEEWEPGMQRRKPEHPTTSDQFLQLAWAEDPDWRVTPTRPLSLNNDRVFCLPTLPPPWGRAFVRAHLGI